MRTRTRGIQVASDGTRNLEKQYKGERIFARLGAVSQEQAEDELRARQREIDQRRATGTQRNFASAAERYLIEAQRKNLRSIASVAQHIELIVPWIGSLPLEAVHNGVLQDFIDERLEDVKPITVNKTLGYVRAILLKAARLWRDDAGEPWLRTAPLIEMLDATPREPYPLTWAEQSRLFLELPPHLERMALFAVNTGLRSRNIYGLRWRWERRIPELGRSVFVIPGDEYKTKRPHVVILNDVGKALVEEARGRHQEFVFTYKNELRPGHPVGPVKSINNTAWRKARERALLSDLRVHDLRHTFAHRLRAAGVAEEDRAVLMGHAVNGMSQHYATPQIARMIEQANLVGEARDSATILRMVQKSHAESHAQRKTA